MTDGNSKLVLTEVDKGIATVRLNRPEKLNAVDDNLLAEFVETLSNLHDEDLKGLIITGAGRAMCAGRDLDLVTNPEYEVPNLTHRLEELLVTFPRPTAAAAKGAAVGMGFHIALDCDFVILGEETHFSYPEIQYNIDRSIVIDKLEAYVGPGVAKEIVMGGEPIEPRRAYTLGLVNHLVPEDTVETRTHDFLRTIVDHDHEAISTLIAESRLTNQ